MNIKLKLASAGLIALSGILSCPAVQAAEWAEQAFPELKGYSLQLQNPKIEKANEYSRTAIYSGKKKVRVTIARSERFGKMLSAHQLPKTASEARLKGHRCWILQGKKGTQLMLMLKNQELLLLAGDASSKPKDLLDVAAKFDLQNVQQALALSPETGENPELKPYSELKPGIKMSQVLALLGPPDHDLGDGDFKLIYELEDGSKMQVGGKMKLNYVRHILADGSSENLI